ncbi:MAG: class I SAM-dependent methyltransferase [Nitrososphaerales archaeon]
MDSVASTEPGGKPQRSSAWAQGDGGQILKFQQQAADAFVARLGLQPGERVLDVACGVGNAAVAAARAGAVATGLDIAEMAIEQARARAHVEGLAIAFDVGDVEAMPYNDGNFDVVLSMFGAMFALHPEQAAAELARVCRPGGRIVLANWPPDSLIARLYRTTTGYVSPPSGSPPFLWGQEEPVRRWLGPFVTQLELQRQPYVLRFPFGPGRAAEAIGGSVGPVRQALTALDAERRAALQADLEQLFSAQNRAVDGSTEIETEYLEVRGLRI